MRRGISLVELLVYLSLFAIFSVLTGLLIKDTYEMFTINDTYSALSRISQRLKIRMVNALTSTALILDRDTAQAIWNRRGAMTPQIGDVITTRFPRIEPRATVESLPSDSWGNVLGVIRLRGTHTVVVNGSEYTVRLYQLTFIYPTLIRGLNIDRRIVLAYWRSETFVSATEVDRFFNVLPEDTFTALREALVHDGIDLVASLTWVNNELRLRFYDLRRYPTQLIGINYDDILSNGTGDIINEFRMSYSIRASDYSIAFNTTPSPIDSYDLPFRVPFYITTDDPWFPSGFEVAVCGPNSARTLYIRITLIARVMRVRGRRFSGKPFDVLLTIRETF